MRHVYHKDATGAEYVRLKDALGDDVEVMAHPNGFFVLIGPNEPYVGTERASLLRRAEIAFSTDNGAHA